MFTFALDNSIFIVETYMHMRFDEKYCVKPQKFERNEKTLMNIVTTRCANRNTELIFNFIVKG